MPRETLEQVRRYIVEGLASGQFTKGQKLPAEREFAERFGTSRASIRQALVILETEKQVTRSIGRGTFISEAADSNVAAANSSADNRTQLENGQIGGCIDTSPAMLMEARQLFEPHLMQLVVINATETDLRRIHELVKKQEALEKTESFEDSDLTFHRALAEASHNDMVIALSNIINGARQNREWQKLKAAVALRDSGRRDDAIAEHSAIARALTARDAAEASLAMRRHLDNVRFNLLGH